MRVVKGLDELEHLLGVELGPSEWVTVTQEMVTAFSEVTGDHQWIHLDAERAARELPGGGTIVQGFFTLALVVKFQAEILTVDGATRLVNYGLNRVRFPAPVRVGTRVRGTQTLVAAERVAPEALRVTSSFVVVAEGVEKPACVAETVMLVYA